MDQYNSNISHSQKISLKNPIDFRSDTVTLPSNEMLQGIDILKENVSFWMGNFENISFTEGGGLPGTDIGFWGGNTYPVSDAMSGPNNVRMYGTWDITNSTTGKEATFKHYVVLNFNEDGQVHTVTEYADVGGLMTTFDE